MYSPWTKIKTDKQIINSCVEIMIKLKYSSLAFNPITVLTQASKLICKLQHTLTTTEHQTDRSGSVEQLKKAVFELKT